MLPAFDSSEDAGRIGLPDERLRLFVVFVEKAVDGGLKVGDRAKDAAFQATFGEGSDESFDGVDPRTRRRREVEGEARMSIEPTHDVGMLVRRVIVEDHVDDLSNRDIRFDRVQKANELLMPVALHAAPDDLAIENIKRCEEGRGAATLVIMGHRAGAAFLHRQSRLGAVESLDLRFLVDREHDRMRRGIDIKADDIDEFFDEALVLRQFERADTMRREPVRRPDALNRERRLTPAASAMARPVQWVVSPGGSASVRSTMRLTRSAANEALPGGRVLSRNKPSTPSRMKCSFQRQTTGFESPDRRIVSIVPQPSAVASMTSARAACFCWLLRSRTIRSRRSQSSGVTSKLIPTLIPRA